MLAATATASLIARIRAALAGLRRPHARPEEDAPGGADICDGRTEACAHRRPDA